MCASAGLYEQQENTNGEFLFIWNVLTYADVNNIFWWSNFLKYSTRKYKLTWAETYGELGNLVIYY